MQGKVRKNDFFGKSVFPRERRHFRDAAEPFYGWCDSNPKAAKKNKKGRTMAFQISEELFQRDFVLNLITQALDETDTENAKEQNAPLRPLSRSVWPT